MNSNDLQIILNSNVSLVVIETYDELKAIAMLQSMFQSQKMPAFKWTVTQGLNHLGLSMENSSEDKYQEPEELLRHIKYHRPASAFILCDFHPYLADAKNIRYLKEVALHVENCEHKVILLSHGVKLPPDLIRYAACVTMSMPTEDEIMNIVRGEAKQWSLRNKKSKIKTDNISLKKLVNNLKGLTHQDVKRLAYGAIADDGVICESDLPDLAKSKFQLMDMEGVLHFEYGTAHLKDVAGLCVLKEWLHARRLAITSDNENSQLDSPKGVLLFGVQGGGKSLAAKAIAGIWGLPLLRLDMGALFNKYIGETEKNLREALKMADTMSPCVLWIDEIEKGLSQGDSDGGTPKRLLGTLLTWMSERKTKVFMVATSNDISQLPPELMRKGRFDEIFFVDLPCCTTRSAIFNIHLEKRGFKGADFNLSLLGEVSDGFTGAEIEQAIVSAMYNAASSQKELKTEKIIKALESTQPLSVVMAEKIQALKEWAQDRAVRAD